MFGIFGPRNIMNRSCKRVLMQLCETMSNAPIYAGLETTIHAFCEGIVRIHQEKDGHLVNNFDFYPNSDGWIDSVAIYGCYLDSHYRTISNSMEIFGLKVSEISHEGDYVDCELDQDQFPH